MDHSAGIFPTHPVLRVAGEVRELVKSVAGVDPGWMSTPDKAAALLELGRARDELAAVWMRVAAEADEVAADSGARDVGAWFAVEAGADRGRVRGDVRTAVALATRWREVEAALAAGGVSLGQAEAIAGCLDTTASALAEEPGMDRSRASELLALAEAELLRLAEVHGPRDLRRLGERILTLVAPQVAEEVERRALEAAEARAAAATSLRFRRQGDGSTVMHGRLPDQAVARLKTYLDAYTSPRVADADDARDPATGERLPGHRLAGEAFVALLEGLDPEVLPTRGGAATTLVVTIDLTTLMEGLGEAVTGDGTRISAGQARRLACAAGMVPVVLGGQSQPLDVGRKRRLFTPAQRIALALAHPSCQADGCEVPSSWCEAHHRSPWSKGGKTDLADGMVLCSWHHHRVHDPAYRHRLLPDGSVRFSRRT